MYLYISIFAYQVKDVCGLLGSPVQQHNAKFPLPAIQVAVGAGIAISVYTPAVAGSGEEWLITLLRLPTPL